MTVLRILAADIGGTNARFAEAEVDGLSRARLSDPVVFPTASDTIDSFDALLAHYLERKPAGSPDLEDYDALAIAIAGAVSGRKATMPNITWEIDLSVSRPVSKVFLLNDFFAQAHAYLDPAVFDDLRLIRPGPGAGRGAIAVVGAGTGLGHAALKSVQGERAVLTSEAGHCTFAFHGESERAIESSMLSRRGKTWLSSEDVLQGAGIPLLHEALTGQSVSPAEALARAPEESETCKWYARFYARACRNYCLAIFPVEALIVTGGIAAKNPHVVESSTFLEEFNDARTYRPLLERIPIYLNEDQTLGLRGAALHAWMQLRMG